VVDQARAELQAREGGRVVAREHPFEPVAERLLGLGNGHLLLYVFDLCDILGVFGRQFLLRLAGRVASQGHNGILDGNIGLEADIFTIIPSARLGHRSMSEM
jgi:hypothetical protein